MAMKRFNSLSRDDIERIVAKRKTHGYLSLLLDKGPFPKSLLPVAMKEGARALPTYEDLRRWLEEIKSGKMSKKEAALFAKVISFLLPDIDEPGDFDAAGYLIVLRSAAASRMEIHRKRHWLNGLRRRFGKSAPLRRSGS